MEVDYWKVQQQLQQMEQERDDLIKQRVDELARIVDEMMSKPQSEEIRSSQE